ncbi:oxygenase MpaB family protein [Rhodococcus sp. NPDC003322]
MSTRAPRGTCGCTPRHTVPQLIAIAYEDRDLSSVIRFGHEQVKGRLESGVRYHALNPDVFFFQHATYVDTLMTMVDTFIRPLHGDEREQLYRECCSWYRRYGISARAMPETWGGFEKWFADACARELALGPDGEYYRDQVLRPDHWVVKRVPSAAVRQMMHPRARELYGVQSSGSGGLTRYALRRRLVAAAVPDRRHIAVATRAFARVDQAAGSGSATGAGVATPR